MYLIKNSIIVIIGLFFAILLLKINIYFKITPLEINDYYISFFKNDFFDVVIILIIYFLILFILSLINYLISSSVFTNYYSFVLALIIGSIHFYILKENNVGVDINSFFMLLSIEIFLLFFINYSTKY